MADKKISNLTNTTTVADADLLTTVQGGINKNLSGAAARVQFNTGVKQLDFDITSGAPSHNEGTVFYDNVDKTLALYNNESDVTLQFGLEQWKRVKNDTGSLIENGSVVFINGASAGITTVQKTKADIITTADGIIGVATHDIENGTIGIATTFGVVRDVDTDAFSPGDNIYISASTAGAFTATRPEYPNYSIRVGVVGISDAVNGTIHVNITGKPNDIYDNTFNGTFIESIDFLVSSDGVTITGSLERTGGGDLTMSFSDGFTVLDTTPAETIVLTAGTEDAPLENFIYILQSTKVLTISTSDWPSGAEHIKVANVVVRDAATTQTDKAVGNRNWNDHLAGSDQQGDYTHVSERLRVMDADWWSGVDPTITITPNGGSPDNVDVATTSGIVYQKHRQSFPAFDTAVSSDLHLVNDFTNPYKTITDLNEALTDSTGASMSGKHFSLTLWGIQNKTGEMSHLMINLPGGSYNTESAALADSLQYNNQTIPQAFRGTGFLIARLTFKHSVAASGTWTLENQKNLLGTPPNIAGGGSTVNVVSDYADTQFTIFNNADNTKIIDFDASAITTANTRTIIMADRDVDLDSPTFTDYFGSGTFGSGTALPISGADTKNFWYSKKAAFRTGRVRGAEWDDGNIGNYSFAGGLDSTASGNSDFAYGEDCIASGGPSVAMGYFCEANAFGAVALGDGNVAGSSAFYSFLAGSTNTSGEQYSSALGYLNVNTSRYSQSFGQGLLNQSMNAMIIGRNNVAVGQPTTWVATDTLFVIGNGASAGARNDAFTVLKNGNIILDGDISSAKAITITPGAGLGMNIVLSTTGDFAINTTDFHLDTTTGDVAIGKLATANEGKLDVLTPANNYGFVHESSTGVKFTTYTSSDGAWIGTKSTHSLNIFTNDSSIQHAFDVSGNFICGNNDTGSVATGAGAVMFLSSGILGSALANSVQMTSEDITSGNTTLSLRTEGTGIHTTGIGSVAGDSEVILKINGTDVHLAGNSVARTNGVNNQTGTTYTLTASDMDSKVKCTNASAIVVTLPEDTTETLLNGFRCFVQMGGAGQVSFATEGTDVFKTADSLVKLRTTDSGVWIFKETSGLYYGQGDLTA